MRPIPPSPGRLETYRLGSLLLLKKYGPTFLNEKTYEARVDERLRAYHRYLAKKVFELKKSEFWAYHRTEMAKLGFYISPFRLISAIGLQLLNFKETAGLVRRSLRQRRHKSPQSIHPIKKWDVADLET